MARRASWVLYDQVLSSLSNFLLSVLVVRTSSAREVGAFAVAYGIYLFTVSLSRTMASDLLMIRCSAVSSSQWQAESRASTGLALGLGTGSGVIVASIGLLLGDPLRPALLAMAAVLPGLMLQDSWRFAFFARGKPEKAVANETIWLAAQCLTFLLAWKIGGASLTRFILAWGLTGTLAGLLAARQGRARADVRGGWHWFLCHSRLSGRLTVEYLLDGGSYHAAVLSVGLTAGLSELGLVRAALILMSPLYVLVQGAQSFALAECVRLRSRQADRLLPVLRAFGLALAAAAALYGVITLVAPKRLGVAALGHNWAPAHKLLPQLTAYVVATGFVVAARVGLRVLAAGTEVLRARVLIMPVTLGATVGGSLWAGASGAVTGLMASNGVCALVLWYHLRAVGQRDPDPRPQPLSLGAK